MASLDTSLGDMIKNRRNRDRGSRGQGRTGRGRGVRGSFRGANFGAPRRNPLGVNARSSAVTIAKSFRRNKTLPWQNGLFEDSLKAAGLSGLVTGTKLNISNLDISVTNEDIRELFSEIGELVQYAVHFDKNGRPSGSAEVIFARRSDAFQAFKKYNNVQLDGKPMKIVIIGAKAETPVSGRVNVVGGLNGRRTVVMASGPSHTRGGFRASNRGGGFITPNRGGGFTTPNRGSAQRGRGGGLSSGRGGGRGPRGGRGGGGRWVKKNVEKSADQLDKELESYHAEAMQS